MSGKGFVILPEKLVRQMLEEASSDFEFDEFDDGVDSGFIIKGKSYFIYKKKPKGTRK